MKRYEVWQLQQLAVAGKKKAVLTRTIRQHGQQEKMATGALRKRERASKYFDEKLKVGGRP